MPKFFIDDNIAKAKTLEKEYYTSPVCFEESKEKIFAPFWQFIGDSAYVQQNGSAYPLTLLEGYLNEPLLLTKDKNGELHCLSNVCTHRGNLMVYEPCKINQLRCKYHGRLFSLNGQFIAMPEFKEVENFPTEDDNLHKLPVFKWGRLLFTSLNPLVNAGDVFGEMMQRLHWLPLEKLVYKPEHSKDFMVKANWALYCENYLEGFHIPFVHPTLNQALDFGEYTTEIYAYSNLQLGIGKKGEVCFDLPTSSADYGKNVAAYYFWVYPNMMFNFYPWGLSLNLVQPISPGECKVKFITYISDESKFNTGAGSGLNSVEMEDEEVVQHVQKGIRSRFYSHGRYSVKHEKGTHHLHQLIARSMQPSPLQSSPLENPSP